MNYNPEISGIITGTGHGTTKDGPGWRSIVYFKGCNFRCGWCASPETRDFTPDLLIYPNLEKYPDRIVASCPYNAISITGDGTVTDRAVCEKCDTFDCVESSIDGSRERAGEQKSVAEIIGEILPYKKFHRDYGITLSGGEVTCQWMFFIELLKAAKEHGLHTAAETNGAFDMLPEALPWLDLPIIDLKHPNPKRHLSLTGYSNETVLRNILTIVQLGRDIWVRIPLLPGINDGPDIEDSATLLEPYREKISVEILGYHRMGIPRWRALDREYNFQRLEPPDEDQLETTREVFRNKGFRVIKT